MMKKLAASMLFVLMGFAGVSHASAGDEVSYRSTDGRWSFKLPAKWKNQPTSREGKVSFYYPSAFDSKLVRTSVSVRKTTHVTVDQYVNLYVLLAKGKGHILQSKKVLYVNGVRAIRFLMEKKAKSGRSVFAELMFLQDGGRRYSFQAIWAPLAPVEALQHKDKFFQSVKRLK